jgi:peptidoglycan/xylan/chitin deacetylase (PgdA/CDA1 family)
VKLPVLLYHHVGPARPGTYESLTTSPEAFERHVRWLASGGYTTVAPSQCVAWIRDRAALPERAVMITFDDGYADLATHAFPLLQQHGMSATTFIVTALMGEANRWDADAGRAGHVLMDAAQIRQWASAGFAFGAHGRTHADLTRLGAEALRTEVFGSRDELAAALGAGVDAFAYPYGFYDDAVVAAVGSAYAIAFTVEEGLNDTATNLLRMRRSMVLPNDALADVALRVRFGSSPLQAIRRGTLEAARRVGSLIRHGR